MQKDRYRREITADTAPLILARLGNTEAEQWAALVALGYSVETRNWSRLVFYQGHCIGGNSGGKGKDLGILQTAKSHYLRRVSLKELAEQGSGEVARIAQLCARVTLLAQQAKDQMGLRPSEGYSEERYSLLKDAPPADRLVNQALHATYAAANAALQAARGDTFPNQCPPQQIAREKAREIIGITRALRAYVSSFYIALDAQA